jgi:hypothetical protein
MLASFLGVLPILTPSLCALAFIMCLTDFISDEECLPDLQIVTCSLWAYMTFSGAWEAEEEASSLCCFL